MPRRYRPTPTGRAALRPQPMTAEQIADLIERTAAASVDKRHEGSIRGGQMTAMDAIRQREERAEARSLFIWRNRMTRRSA